MRFTPFINYYDTYSFTEQNNFRSHELNWVRFNILGRVTTSCTYSSILIYDVNMVLNLLSRSSIFMEQSMPCTNKPVLNSTIIVQPFCTDIGIKRTGFLEIA